MYAGIGIGEISFGFKVDVEFAGTRVRFEFNLPKPSEIWNFAQYIFEYLSDLVITNINRLFGLSMSHEIHTVTQKRQLKAI